MMEEEGAVMGGLLVGLNVIDANLCIKGEDLDSQVSPVLPIHQSHPFFLTANSDHFVSHLQVGVIDFSLYLKDPVNSETPKE